MKNYEVKYATKELADANIKTIKQTNKRLAYLVSNMYSKMKSGFAKKINGIVVVYQEEQRSKLNTVPVQQSIVSPISVQTPVTNVVENNKPYIIKAYLADVEALSKNRKIRTQAPKKLLISTLFLQKLIGNRMKNIKELNKKNNEIANKMNFANAQEEAVYKYISLNDDMKVLIKQVEEKKAEMISLAKEHGLTRSMVENAMAKNKAV